MKIDKNIKYKNYKKNIESKDTLLSVIVPCFNEINTLEKVIDKIKKSPIKEKEIIIIDDFSIDGSREYLKNLIDNQIITKFHNRNMGKGAAISTGIKTASGKIIIIQDADLEYDPDEYPNMINPIVDNKADIVYGSRFKGGQPHRVVYFWHRVGNGF